MMSQSVNGAAFAMSTKSPRAKQAGRYKTFDLRMKAEATDLIEEGGRMVGLRAETPDRTFTIRADLMVGCDGRHSTVREKAQLARDDYGAPMDVLWFCLSRKNSDATDTFGHIEAGKLMIMLDRGDYWQCAYVIPKGGIVSGPFGDGRNAAPGQRFPRLHVE
jgi:2-polyprenyl-6-methoxyphenol hydroxylase-like FAD-dependent oxidoreductase